jgi:DNA-binding transcriptional ArsR family regulator
MAYIKTEVFSTDLQEFAKAAKAFSHPARLAILQYLAKQEKCISGDISDEIPLSRTTVSQHLQELRKLGIIQGTVSGTKVNYCLNPNRISELHSLFEHFFYTLKKNKTDCKTVV